jgi:hypothetical protein
VHRTNVNRESKKKTQKKPKEELGKKDIALGKTKLFT